MSRSHRPSFASLFAVLLCASACGSRPAAAPVAPAPLDVHAAPVAPPAARPALAVSPSTAEEALAAWGRRADEKELRRAITLWERIVDEPSANVATLTLLTRAYGLLAEQLLAHSGDKDAALTLLERGVRAGERALLASSPALAAQLAKGARVEEAATAIVAGESAVAAFWYAATLARFAVTKDLSATVYYRDRVVALLERVRALDESLFFGAPDGMLAWFYAAAPDIAGGDPAKARARFERALTYEPSALMTRVRYAEAYAVKAGDRALFVKLLSEVTAAQPHRIPEIEPEEAFAQERARALLAQIDNLF